MTADEHANPFPFIPCPPAWFAEFHALMVRRLDAGLTTTEAARLAELRREEAEFQNATDYQRWQSKHNLNERAKQI